MPGFDFNDYIFDKFMKLKCTIILLAFALSIFQSLPLHAFYEKVDGLEYDVRKITDAPIEKVISQNYDLYELYLENRSDKTFSIPGYSIDLGVIYAGPSEISSLSKDKSQRKFNVLNLAAGAASIAFGGITRSAARTAVNSFNSFRKKNSGLDDSNGFLSANKTYILYPGYGISLFLLVNKSLGQVPSTIRFVCHEEDTNVNYVVINNNLKLRENNTDIQDSVGSNEKNCDLNKKTEAKENVIAVPGSSLYK